VPDAVLPGSTYVALAAPAVTVPDVTALPITVAPCFTVNVTVPTPTAPAPLVTIAVSVTFWLLALKLADAFAAAVVVAAVFTVSVCVLSLLPANPPPALYVAVIVYAPAAVFAGNTNVALAAPPVTVPDVTGDPTAVPPCDTANVTVPAFTVPAPLVTVAASVTFWLLSLNVAVSFAAVVVVAPVPTLNVCVTSLLVAKLPAALYTAWIV
jgi:hypothetical protein